MTVYLMGPDGNEKLIDMDELSLFGRIPEVEPDESETTLQNPLLEGIADSRTDGSYTGPAADRPQITKEYNEMCRDCQHLEKGCEGTHCTVYSDCIWKTATPEQMKRFREEAEEEYQEEKKKWPEFFGKD